MKFLYLHKYPIPYLNDDEGSIGHCLRQAGHEVIYEEESKWDKHQNSGVDFTLFHHWYSAEHNVAHLPGKSICWYFDHVDFSKSVPNDYNLVSRNKYRIRYMDAMRRNCDYVFHTDGDFSGDNCKVLRQGADARLVGKFKPHKGQNNILFPGGRRGVDRNSFISVLSHKYGKNFRRILNEYRHRLANRVTQSGIVVAPDSPITDRYWSNRVYVMLGFGAFLLHPYCEELATEYEDGEEIVFYCDREDLIDKIDYYLTHSEERVRIANGGLARTVKEHLYTHRVQEMLKCLS